MSVSDLMNASAAIPTGGDGPVFAEPWQAKVFAMTLQAHEAGLFSWPEWADALGKELAKDNDLPADEQPIGYYDHWLTAFESLLEGKDVAGPGVLAELKSAWDKAARATPHGQPIELKDEPACT